MAQKALRLEVVPRSLGGAFGGSRKAVQFGEGRWIVSASPDPLSHYVSLVGNLTSRAAGASTPAFQYVRTVVKEGLPRSAFDRVRGAVGVTADGLSALTGIPLRTLSRRRKLKPDESERLLRVASAFQKAVELFRDLEKARAWFTSPKAALAGLAPLECCDTEAGCREVESLLGRVEESVYW